jgi:hypothetical protein
MFKLTKVAKVVQVNLTIDLAKCIQAATGLLVVLHQIGWL